MVLLGVQGGGVLQNSISLRNTSPFPLCSGETPPEVLRPALKTLTQERHRPVIAAPEEDHKYEQRAGTPLL